MYTDMGHITTLDDLPWRGQDNRDHAGLLDPAGPDGITVYNTRIGDGRNISISFHDNVFDRGTIDLATEHLSHPTRFLA
jgi:hypothetical protein